MNDSKDNDICEEHEISYTLTLPQDLLYVVKRYLDKHYLVKENYVEIVDVNHVRTRLQNGKFVSVCKRIVDVSRHVVLSGSEFIPVLDRHSVETLSKTCCTEIRRLCKVLVYDHEGIEIKFEHIYYEYNDGDSLDPLMVSKQIALHNVLLDEKPIDVTTNSHLGSDEILANCRLELEYETGKLSQSLLHKMADLIAYIETVVVTEKIEPFIQHTSVLNETVLRPFVDEVDSYTVHENDYSFWAVKLDGVRGRGYIVNGERVYLQLDDMRLFSGKLSSKLGHNKILCIQVEFIESLSAFYVTDIVSVYKFLYDNRNQFEKSSPYQVGLLQAIQFLNDHQNRDLNFACYMLRFQTYATSRDPLDLSVPNDGYIAVTRAGELVKIKDHRSVEMRYKGNNVFECTFGVYRCLDVVNCETEAIYEVVVVRDDVVRVIKHRTDRIVPN